MLQIFDQIILYLQYPFVIYAIVVAVLISLCSALLGVTLVLKQFSFIGDGLSHVAFGAMALAAVFSLTNSMIFILACTILCAVQILQSSQNSSIRGDAAIAMLSVGSLALGYFLMNIFATGPNIAGDVCATLFGSSAILTLSKFDMYLSIALSILVIFCYICLYHKIFAITFDENFAKATGLSVKFYNLALAIIVAIIIVLAMNLVGSLLISALVIFPALCAMRICNSFLNVTIVSCILSIICSLIGIFASIIYSTPVGATIVMVDIVAFIIFYIISYVKVRI